MDAIPGTSAAPCLPPGGRFEIVFSFDTTGSMSRVIDEVKGRVQDMIQRLQADIPGIRFGIIAHGDYCDKDVFYLEKHIDFTTDIVQLTNFVQNIEGTGGGDPEECYEYILWLTRTLSWSAGSKKALVMIGDSVPHEPNYELNLTHIDWREATTALAGEGIKIYSVQAFDDEKATDFFETIATMTEGHHLKLGDFSNVCDFIMAICYREGGDEFLEGYEAEVRAREVRKGLHKDLEGLFGVLRRGDSSASNSKGSIVKTPSVMSNISSTGAVSQLTRVFSTASSVSDPKTAVVAPLVVNSVAMKTPCSKLPVKVKKTEKVSSRINKKGRLVMKRKSDKNDERKNVIRHYRHQIPDTRFILKKRGLKRRWSKWALVMTGNEKLGTRKNTWTKRKGQYGWRTKQLFPKSDFVGKSLYEIAVQKFKGRKLNVMLAKCCCLNPSETNWEKRIINNDIAKAGVNHVLKNGGRIFIRRFVLQKLGKLQKNTIDAYRKGQVCQFAWKTGMPNAGRLSWAF